MTELQDRPEENEGQAVWEGEPIGLTISNDRSYRGLTSSPFFPGRHTQPARLAAAQDVKAAEADIKKLHDELAERVSKRQPLEQRARAAGRERGPGWLAATHALKDFDTESQVIEQQLIADAEADLQEATDNLAAVVHATQGEQAAYGYQVGPGIAQEAIQHLQAGLSGLLELQDIEAQSVGEQILEPASDANTPAGVERSSRKQSLQRLIAGEDLGSQGVVYGLIPLAYDYLSKFTRRGLNLNQSLARIRRPNGPGYKT